VFVATDGAGVARFYRDKVDGVSGASEYAQWGPIEIPSDKVYSICLTPDGAQWFGTDMGVGKHTGYNTLENWTVYTSENGLVDNFVQAIAYDKDGRLWFGTKGGVSMFDGTSWSSLTEKDGLSSNNVLSIAADKGGIVWLGTDNGVTSVNNGKLTSYK
jgi:ligand-binding sensor domain-containing protein